MFTVLHFGGRSSPYLAGQAQSRISEAYMGDPHDTSSNCWQWDRVYLNLPYSVDYDVSMPRVMLIHKDGELATHCAIFVDDIHPSGHAQKGDENTKRACKQPKSRMNLRGRRAGDRKHREPSPTPGAWNGVIIYTDIPFPRKSMTQKK